MWCKYLSCMGKERIYDRSGIRSLADGNRSTSEIAKIVGLPVKFVQSVVLRENLPRRPQGPHSGEKNQAWNKGLRIDRDGYLLMRFREHPNARRSGYFLAHRFVYEIVCGRILEKREVIDHVNGLHLDNRPENLCLFESNGLHLHSTVSGRPRWSEEGMARMRLPHHQRAGLLRIDSYRQARALYEVHGRHIRLLSDALGTDAQSLLKTVVRKLLAQGRSHPLTTPAYLLGD